MQYFVPLALRSALAYAGANSGSPTLSMICPICKHAGARRSRRQTVADYMVSAMGLYPWRCRECHQRFHARLMPLSNTLHAHCSFCGNLDLQRISPEYVDTTFAFVWRFLGVPSFRCEPCRHKYFSVRPLREFPEHDTQSNGLTSYPAD